MDQLPVHPSHPEASAAARHTGVPRPRRAGSRALRSLFPSSPQPALLALAEALRRRHAGHGLAGWRRHSAVGVVVGLGGRSVVDVDVVVVVAVDGVVWQR